MAGPSLRVTIVVVSETATRDPASDSSGPLLKEILKTNNGTQWTVEEVAIVPDNIMELQHVITQWTDSENPVNLVLTTGGTGFATKDVTPEAISPLLHKHASGLVHAMLATSLAITPFAMMARPVAGIRHKSLIVTLPGSPKGAKENLEAILKLLPHACVQAAGANSRALHAGGVDKLERDAGIRKGVAEESASAEEHHIHQGHRHNSCHGNHKDGHHNIPKPHTDPEFRLRSKHPEEGATQRHRASPFPMLSVDEALQLIADHTPPLRNMVARVDSTLIGKVLAEDVKAEEAVPAFRASIVDGYALIVPPEGPSPQGVFPVVSVSHANPGEVKTLSQGQIARVTTGAPLPPGATSVVMVEDTVLRTTTDDGKEEKEVEILTDQVKPGENVREIGSDVRAGDVILKQGEQVTAIGGELGLLASVGKREVLVYKQPTVGILSTGDEIVPHDRPGDLRFGEVRDSNRPSLIAAVKGLGFEAVDLGIVKDNSKDLESALHAALTKADVLVTTGGASMGELDLIKPTIEHNLNGTIHFGRVSMKPGKPTTFATIPFPVSSSSPSERDLTQPSKPIFSLPGNPASALVTLYLFVLPCLHQLSGICPLGLPKAVVTLDQAVSPDPQRPEYHRAMVSVGKDGALHAISTGGQRSSRVGSLRSANALLCLERRSRRYEVGERVEALLMGRVLDRL